MAMKIPKLMIFTLLFGLAACSPSEPAETNQTSTSQQTETSFVILALGDSLTEGLGVQQEAAYPAVLQQQLRDNGFPQVQVINAGLSGETTTGLKNRVAWILQLEPDVTVLNIGANDAMRGLDLKLTEANIRYIVATLQEAGSDVILAGMEIYDNLGREYVSGFKDMYPRIAKDMNVPLIAFFLQGVAGDPDLNQNDGIHPNAAGYEIIVNNNILPAVSDYLKQQNL